MSGGLSGQDLAMTLLRTAVERAEVSHAWAFVGPSGVGQRRAARMLAAALNCDRTERGVPCGACDVCARCERGAHPAYTEFVPVGAAHRVTEVREQWLREASRTLVEGQRKVLYVVDADRMNEAAANAFLKVLEEPPPSTVWILEVADPDELPDTILSRCRTVRFRTLGRAALEAEASSLGVPEGADRDLALRVAMGSAAALARFQRGADDVRAHREFPRRLREHGPGEALLIARELDDEAKRRTAALKQAGKAERASLEESYGEKLPKGVQKELDDRQARLEREARTVVVSEALDDLLAWYRDCLLIATGGAAADAVHADDPEGLAADAAALGPGLLLRAGDLVLEARANAELNLQQALALEALFLELATLTMKAPAGR